MMKILVLLLASAAAPLVDSSSFLPRSFIQWRLNFFRSKPISKCIPNSVFTYDHNICYCDDEGLEFTCKRQIYSMVHPQLNSFQLQNITTSCKSGERFEHMCKDCICQNNDKYALCVNSECTKNETISDEPEKCIPGSVFKKLCNGCICGPNGTAACTRLDCSVVGWKMNVTQCVPSSFFKLGCNDCDCAKDGKSMSCTKNGCGFMTFYHEHVLNVTMNCEANNPFSYNCHGCFCHESGEYAMCSGKQCPHIYDLERVEDTVEQCNPGMIFANDCNTCICNNDGKGICTTLNCDIRYKFKYVENLNFAPLEPDDPPSSEFE